LEVILVNSVVSDRRRRKRRLSGASKGRPKKKRSRDV
jgi:hypothetical protein